MSVRLTEAPRFSDLSSPEFDAFVAECTETLRIRQEAVEARWHFTEYRLQGFHQDEGIVRLVRADGRCLRADDKSSAATTQ